MAEYVPVPLPLRSAPTLGVVFARKFKPNCADPTDAAVWLDRAAIVGVPEHVVHVRVEPLTVIT